MTILLEIVNHYGVGDLVGEVFDYLLPPSLPTMNCMLALLPISSCKMSRRLPKFRVLPVRSISQSHKA